MSNQKRPFTVSLITEKGQTPLTVPIQDEDKAALSYTLLYSMIENDAEFNVKGELITPTADQIYLTDAIGDSFKPQLDSEWYGTKDDKEAVRKAALEKDRKAAEKEGEPWNQEFEEKLQEEYSVLAYDKKKLLIHFAPETWDFDKANDMFNLMQFGMEDHISISVEWDGERVEFSPKDVSLTNEDGEYLEGNKNPNWANERSDLALNEADLAGLTNEEALEQ